MNCPLISKLKIGEGCENTSCRHNMFWDRIGFNKKSGPTEVSLKFSNCMCLLDEELTLEDIGQMYGITRERVRQIEMDATIKLLKFGLNGKTFLKDLELNRSFIRRKYNELRTKKYKYKFAIEEAD